MRKIAHAITRQMARDSGKAIRYHLFNISQSGGSRRVTNTERIVWPIGGGLAGVAFLTSLYFAIVSWAESPQHALDLFWDQRWIILPLIVGFGVQSALYIILKKRLFVPDTQPAAAGAITGAGGATSTLAMVACCAHHVTEMLPILGLTAAATFLAEYQTAFMLAGQGTTLAGIAVMLFILARERRKFFVRMNLTTEPQ